MIILFLKLALLFLSHFMGDIHQVYMWCIYKMKLALLYFSLIKITELLILFLWMKPLHVGFTSDRGGNTIDIHWYRTKTVLHHVSTCNEFFLLVWNKKQTVFSYIKHTGLGYQHDWDLRNTIIRFKPRWTHCSNPSKYYGMHMSTSLQLFNDLDILGLFYICSHSCLMMCPFSLMTGWMGRSSQGVGDLRQ